METKAVLLERLLDAPVSSVWQAITDKDEMKKWYFDLPEFKAEVGFKFQFVGCKENGEDSVEYVHLCEVTEVIPEKRLTYSWCYDGYSGISFVTFELFEADEKTLLRLSHKGIESFPKENPDFAIHNFEEGWSQIIGRSLIDFLK
jgi:uncharacterized protein YndB with AHSA1/START domain